MGAAARAPPSQPQKRGHALHAPGGRCSTRQLHLPAVHSRRGRLASSLSLSPVGRPICLPLLVCCCLLVVVVVVVVVVVFVVVVVVIVVVVVVGVDVGVDRDVVVFVSVNVKTQLFTLVIMLSSPPSPSRTRILLFPRLTLSTDRTSRWKSSPCPDACGIASRTCSRRWKRPGSSAYARSWYSPRSASFRAFIRVFVTLLGASRLPPRAAGQL